MLPHLAAKPRAPSLPFARFFHTAPLTTHPCHTAFPAEFRPRFAPTVSIACGGHSVVAVSLSFSAKKLVVHIDASVEQLRRLPVDIAALHASHDGSQFKGVIVTIAGGQPLPPRPPDRAPNLTLCPGTQATRPPSTSPPAISRLGMVPFLPPFTHCNRAPPPRSVPPVTRSRHTRGPSDRLSAHGPRAVLERAAAQSIVFGKTSEQSLCSAASTFPRKSLRGRRNLLFRNPSEAAR